MPHESRKMGCHKRLKTIKFIWIFNLVLKWNTALSYLKMVSIIRVIIFIFTSNILLLFHLKLTVLNWVKLISYKVIGSNAVEMVIFFSVL